MAQQVTKRWKLLQDINMPSRCVKKGTIGLSTNTGDYVSFGEGRNHLAFPPKDIIDNPDWFEELKDAPFECGGFEINRPTTKSQRFLMHCFYANEIPAEKVPAIRKAIEDIVNGVDEKDKCLFDADKINARLRELELDQLQREAFFAGRKVNTYDFDYPTYEDYKNSKK